MNESLQQLLYRSDIDWNRIENYISSCEPNEVTKNDLLLIIRHKKKRGSSTTAALTTISNTTTVAAATITSAAISNTSMSTSTVTNSTNISRRSSSSSTLVPVPIHIIHALVYNNPNIVDRNILLVVFGSKPSTSLEIIDFLLEHYHATKLLSNDDNDVGDGHGDGNGDGNEKSTKNVAQHHVWAAKFFCDICFGYCPVNVNAVKLFLKKFPEALENKTNTHNSTNSSTSSNTNHLLPLHKICQLKFRRRAKQENQRNNKELFQIILSESIRNNVLCGAVQTRIRTQAPTRVDDSIGGLFKLGGNTLSAMKMLVQTLGEDVAWDWVISVLKENNAFELNDIPILQAILTYYDSTKKTKLRWLMSALSNCCGCATTRDSEGNLPLHIAIAETIYWDDGLGCIVEANIDALEECCQKTGYGSVL